MRYFVTLDLLALLIRLHVVEQEEVSWRKGIERPENSSFAAMLMPASSTAPNML